MKRNLRVIVVAAVVAAPFAIGGTAPAGASCYPEKPSTCQPHCPGGTTRVGPVTACVPIDIQELVDFDCTCPPL